MQTTESTHLEYKYPKEGRLAFAIRRWALQRRFRRRIGCPGDFENPRTHYEKVQYRKLYGNHGFYALVADKYRVREYVARRVGEKYLVPQLAVCDKLTPEIFAALPTRFIIQANHGCKWHRIVPDKSVLDIPETVAYFNRLMRRTYGRKSGDYHYRLIPPKIIINELLLKDGELPADYNFYCYHSRRGFDYALTLSLPGSSDYMNYGRDWQVWDGDFSEEQQRKYAHPQNFREMVDVARELSRDFDFVRVDLYNIHGRIYFGELTCTPAGGLTLMGNDFREKKRNDMWELAADNPLLYQQPPRMR